MTAHMFWNFIMSGLLCFCIALALACERKDEEGRVVVEVPWFIIMIPFILSTAVSKMAGIYAGNAWRMMPVGRYNEVESVQVREVTDTARLQIMSETYQPWFQMSLFFCVALMFVVPWMARSRPFEKWGIGSKDCRMGICFIFAFLYFLFLPPHLMSR